jgi:uncharacterized repeat protein (TIGR01451 family)
MSEKPDRAYFCNSRLKALFLALMPPLWLTMSILPQKSALAQTTSQGCPAGTAPGSRNFITNGDFRTLGGTTFTSDLPYRGDNIYPDDAGGGGISIQSGSKVYASGIVIGEPFPGDPVGAANATTNYLYSNPNQRIDGGSAFPNPTVWRQTVSGLQPNKNYRFIGYFYNLLSPTAGGVAPQIVLGIDAFRSAPITVSTRQQWIPVEFAFTTTSGQTSATLSIIDQANNTFGDDFGMTAVSLNECQSVGIAKSAGTPVANSNGTFTVPYTVTVRNYGSETLSNVQLNDDLTTTFANAAGFVVSNIQSQSLTVNPAYDGGSTNPNLLGTNNSLTTDASATVTFDVTITPGTGPQGFGVFNNTVRATATTTSGAQVSDDSVNGADPDPDADGNPINNSSPTPVTLTPTSRLGVAKAAGVPTINDDGSFTVPYTIAVRNAGNTNLSNLQLTENLSQTFTGATGFSVVPNTLTGTGVAVNSNFNGTSNTNLLAGTDSLAVGANATITFNVRVNPGTNPGPYNNITVGNATGPNNTPVTDQSTDGTNVDPDGDGDPTNNSVPTPVTLTSTPRLGVAKAVGTVTDNNDGSFTVPYTVIIRNAGNINLNNLQITENLSQTFNGVTAFNVQANSLSATGVTVNPNFNGTSNTNLLAGTDSLAVGGNASITFRVRVTPGSNIGPYNNTAVGNALGANGVAVIDQSTDGTNVDPDSDDDPTNNSVPTPVTFTPPRLGAASNLRLVKRITGVTRNGAPFNSVSFTDVEVDTDANALTQAGLRPIGVRAIGSTNSLTSNDEVEYTIYFLSDGGQPASKVNFCDLIPTGTTYIPNSTVVQVGNTQLISSDVFLPSLTPLPAGNSCLDQNNPNGAVIANLGNVPNTSGNNFGFIRLRVKIN